MKKILLSLMFVGTFAVAKSQVLLNEVWYNPNAGDQEYIELFNPGFAESLDCYSLLSYYNNGTTSGFIVIRFPSGITLQNGDFAVLASSMPFTFQGTNQHQNYPGTVLDFPWTDAYLSAHGGSITNYVRSGGTYIPGSISDINNILQDLGNNAQPANFITLLYRNSTLVNGLAVGVGNNHTVPPALKTMPSLTFAGSASCPGDKTAVFSTLLDAQLEYMGSGIGQNNGVHRTANGTCGTWVKSASGSDDTPGSTNGPTAVQTDVIVVGGAVLCPFNPDGSRNATWFVVGSTPASAYPLILQLWSDVGTVPNQLDDNDVLIDDTGYLVPPSSDPNVSKLTGIQRTTNTLIIGRSTAGCFATLAIGTNTCDPLPVKFKSFNAARNHSVVALNWETASEQNNSGFAIERLVGAGGWQQIAFVPTQAAGGNSNADISYQYTDLNNTSAMTQYRLKQIDFDNKSSMSDIRAVRGLGQVGKTIVYPNPTNNGRVSVVFEDVSATRDISLMDMSGRMIKQIKGVTNNNIQFDNLTTGIYSLRVVNRETGDQVVQKIVVNNR